jgi:hypothetical protein
MRSLPEGISMTNSMRAHIGAQNHEEMVAAIAAAKSSLDAALRENDPMACRRHLADARAQIGRADARVRVAR